MGWLALAPTASAADVLLAGYEPSESPELTLTSPDAGMTLTWPLVGGAGGVPAATEGSHVLKLAWTGETDRKVEVRHDFATSTFDLAGHGAILIDVYVETASGLPAIAGIYDDVFFWLEGFDHSDDHGAVVHACDVRGGQGTRGARPHSRDALRAGRR